MKALIFGAVAVISIIVLTAMQTAPTQGPVGSPPEVEVGKLVSVDLDGTGLIQGEIKQIQGSWVKLRVAITESRQQGDVTNVAMAGYDAWVNFDNLTYYRAPRKKQ